MRRKIFRPEKEELFAGIGNCDNEVCDLCTPVSRDSDWLRARRPKGRSSSPGKIKNVPFSKQSRPVLAPTQPTIQCVPWALFPGKAAGA